MTDLALDLLALLAEHAKTAGTDSAPLIHDVMESVPDAAIPADHARVWDAMKGLAAAGTPPTVLALRRAVPGMPPSYWTHLRSDESSIEDVRNAVLRQHQDNQYLALANQIPTLVQSKATVQQINDLLLKVADESVGGTRTAVAGKDVDALGRVMAINAGTIPVIRTPWPWLDSFLGGGFFPGGDTALTGLCAYTGVGKTTLAQQITNKALDDGHWVIVFAGESNRVSYLLGMARLRAKVPKGLIRQGMSQKIIDALQVAQDEIHTKKLFLYDFGFEVDTIRAELSRLAHKMREEKKAGNTPADAQLLFIVDNIDHAVTSGSEREWQALEVAAEALVRTAIRVTAHGIILAQASGQSYFYGRPPLIDEIARSKYIVTHLANFLSAYRPLSQEDLDDEKRNKALIACRKTRTGHTGQMEVGVHVGIGAWV